VIAAALGDDIPPSRFTNVRRFFRLSDNLIGVDDAQGRPLGTQVRLGNPQLAKAAKRGVAAVRANAKQFAANVLPIIEEIERAGITSHNAIAAKLNERNVRTVRGGKWTHVQVGAVLRPFAEAAAAA
jgi:hypothetical protein